MSKKAILAVWRPGSGAQWWRTGMSIESFKSQDAKYFKQGLRLVSIDIFRYQDLPKKYSYTAVWRPGKGAQYWRSGMSVKAFKAEDQKQFNQGRRIALLDIQNGNVFAVWRPGSGAQRWRTGMTAAQMKSEDAKHFKNGLRIAMLKKHGGNSFAAVWRPGTGAQWWRSGMTGPEFSKADSTHFKNGLRIASLDTYGGKFIAVWRPGSGAQWIHAGLTLDEMKKKDLSYFKKGLRLTIARAKKRVQAQAAASPPPKQKDDCIVWATVANGQCYNLDGTVSTILTPGTITASACGPTLEKARENAKLVLSSQMCLTTTQEKKPGCCTFKFQ